jgi:hypothetical protein
MEYFNNYLFGSIAGSVGAIISHPCFIIKTDLQNGKSAKDIFYEMKTKSLCQKRRYLYNGLLRMCIGLSFEKMLVFGTYNSIFYKFDLDKSNSLHSLSAGFLAGIAGSLASTPSEQLVIDKTFNIKNYNVFHLYKAILPTMGRESIGFAVYFLTFDQISRKFNQEKSTLKTALAGTCAISTALLFYYPLDKIKTNMQSNIKINKLENVYKGAHFGLLRAIPFHVTCFCVFENLNNEKIFY